MKWVKRIGIGLGVFVLVLIGAAVAVPLLVPVSAFKDEIEARVTGATGRDFRLAGGLKLSVLPSLELSVENVTFANRAGAAQPHMAKLKGLEFRLKLIPLLSGRFEVDTLVLREPVILLEIDKDGRPNWSLEKTGGPKPPAPGGEADARAAAPGKSAPPFADRQTKRFGAFADSIESANLRVVDGTVKFSDARSGQSLELQKANVTLNLPGAGRPITLDGSGVFKGQSFKVTGIFAHAADDKTVLDGPYSFRLVSDLTTIEARGTASERPKLRSAGKVTVAAPSVRAVLALIGPLPAPGPGMGALAFAADYALEDTRIVLSALNAKSDSIAATGNLTVTLGAIPHLGGALNIPALDLNALQNAGAGTRAAQPAPPAPGAPGAPPAAAAPPSAAAPATLDAGVLKQFNADLELTFGPISSGQWRIDSAQIGLKVAGGALTATIARAALYRGSLTGTLGVAPAARGITVTPRLTASGIDLGGVLRAAGGGDRIQGTLNASTNLTGSGPTPQAIQNSLSGSARIELRNGAVRGLNIATAIRDFNPGGLGKAFNPAEKTDFGEMSASWALRSGVATTSDLRLASPLLRLEGAGSYSIPAQSVDFNVCAKLVASIQGQGAGDKAGISAPWRIHGPTSNLSYVPRVDAKCLAANLEGLKNLKPEDLKKMKPEDLKRVLPIPGLRR